MALFPKHAPRLLLSLSLLLLGCDKDKDPTRNAKLPTATQSGSNTVGFTLENGQVWVPYFECGLGSDPCGKYSASVGPPMVAQNSVGLSFTKSIGGTRSTLSISAASPGTITDIGEKIDSVTVSFRSGEEYGPYPLPGSRFTVTRFDKAAQVISGEFHLILRNQAGKTVTLGNGRFDFRFNACACD